MRPSRVRTLQLVAAGGLAFLAVRPVVAVEHALDWLLLPARGLAELSGPVGWLQSRGVHAASGEASQRRREELEEQERLEAAVLRMARPSDPELVRRLRGLPHLRAEVITRPDGDLDTLLIRLEDPSVVFDDLPVISGNAFVGQLDLVATRDKTDLAPDLFVVRLVTGARYRIGARVAQADCRLVVGGVAALPDTRLAVHSPSDREVTRGRVVVDEPAFADHRADLANGFVLGDLVVETSKPGGRAELLGIDPLLDYATGLHQVQVLMPPGSDPPAAVVSPPLAKDGAWASARLFLRGEPSPRREGRKLALGRRHGVHTGAALASGERFAGRVLHAGVASSDVGMLGDPGLTIPTLALIQVDGRDRVHVLGRLTCLGRDGAQVRMRWPATLALDPEVFGAGPISARLWTGSGEAGVPRGLLLGDAQLPVGPGPHEIELRLPGDGLEPKGLSVRIPRLIKSAGEQGQRP